MRAKKSLGQNFLVDETIAARIVREFAPQPDEIAIEIGAGRGALTKKLVERVGHLIAVEFDRDLAPGLRERFSAREKFSLIEADALTLDYCALIASVSAAANFEAQSARLIANLPYNISTAIVQKLIAERACISEMLLMLQREVVERLVAPPGSKERGFLSVFVEAHCESEKVFDVAPEAFRPVPKVWSAVVRLRVRENGSLKSCDEKLLWEIVSCGFAQRRKTILNNLRAAHAKLRARIEAAGGAERVLSKAGIEAARRAETLSLDEWIKLTNSLV
jgi:16S rRNA (adenine1518-N6/adenine1519-N6)-dimethyltransferase